MKKLTCLLLCLMLLCGTALADGTFTCGLCGWTGAAMKFCGGCGAEIALQWTCVQCGNTNNGTKFCGECGTQRPVVEDPRWTCTSCGTVNDGTKYCGECGAKKPAAADMSIKPGDFVTFGHYPQTAAGNDMTSIEWIVLDRDGNKALLISKYVLDSQRYNENWDSVTWETCTLRTWLNNEFINKAFSELERNAIFTTAVDNSQSQGNSEWKTNGGNNTTDQVFLLSYVEAWKYFGSDNDRKATTTEYANREYSNRWWLRSPGNYQYYAALVYSDGSRSHDGSVNSTRGVRPALWVDLESGVF